MQTSFFYGFRPKTVRSWGPKTVRSWDGNRMFLVRKPYGFGTENVKGRLLEIDSIPFDKTNNAYLHECTYLYRKRGYEKKAVTHETQLPLKQVQSFFYLIPMKTTLSLILR